MNISITVPETKRRGKQIRSDWTQLRKLLLGLRPGSEIEVVIHSGTRDLKANRLGQIVFRFNRQHRRHLKLWSRGDKLFVLYPKK
jgi:hypothetical protein